MLVGVTACYQGPSVVFSVALALTETPFPWWTLVRVRRVVVVAAAATAPRLAAAAATAVLPKVASVAAVAGAAAVVVRVSNSYPTIHPCLCGSGVKEELALLCGCPRHKGR